MVLKSSNRSSKWYSMDFDSYGVETYEVPKEKGKRFWHVPSFSDGIYPGKRIFWMEGKVLDHGVSIDPNKNILDF